MVRVPDAHEELNVSELDDAYLKILLLLATRRADSSEPRRAGFWHGLASTLSAELEMRQGMARLGQDPAAVLQADDEAELEAVLDEMRRDVATIESEYRAAYGHMPRAGN